MRLSSAPDRNYDDAIAVTRLLNDLPPFRASNVDKVLTYGLHNDQMYTSACAFPNLCDFYKKNKHRIPERRQRYFDTTFSRRRNA